MGLKETILRESAVRGIDPYKQEFRPSDLGIKASEYGSFSDHCSEEETQSGQYNREVILKVVERTLTGRPRKYVLLDNGS